MIQVFGHKAPDTDSTGSPLIFHRSSARALRMPLWRRRNPLTSATVSPGPNPLRAPRARPR